MGGQHRAGPSCQGPGIGSLTLQDLALDGTPERPSVLGKFLHAGGRKLHVRGVTYGTFRPDAAGNEYPALPTVEIDFELMSKNGINAVRTYTVPPRDVLDAGERRGLRFLIGLAVERSVGHLNHRGGAKLIESEVRRHVRACAGHPVVLCYALGNEIPASVARWFGPRRIERLLARLTRAVHEEDPGALVTYANYPSTEYLQLPFLDLLAFNVFLEDRARLAAYLARLHNLANDRPLIMTELGLDSIRAGEAAQAASVQWQLEAAFDAGCAGAFVYAWTDEWHRGGEDVQDWAFGLTRRDRTPKPALKAASATFAGARVCPDPEPPRVSVVVCTHNGAATLRDCLEGVAGLDYPNFETIVVADGCSDDSAAIADELGARLLVTPALGLSHARNCALAAADGDIVAYLDDDARPDPDWLRFLVAALGASEQAAVGGPNLPWPGAPPVAQCVDNVPGVPTHVLLSDSMAEHIPGCNMAFWRERLNFIGGFDPQFRTAGDDVDVCWRLQEQGWTIAFSPAAVVFHRRRETVRGFLRQQLGYGRAEAMLESKWPGKYNGLGHLLWRGRLYAKAAGEASAWRRRRRVEYGVWGAGLFQRLYTRRAGPLESLAGSPEWYLVIGVAALLCLLALAWPPLVVAIPALSVAVLVAAGQALIAGARAAFDDPPASRLGRVQWKALTALLRLLGPAARLAGRVRHGLTPWRRRGGRFAVPRPRNMMLWSECRREAGAWLDAIEAAMRSGGAAVRRGSAFTRWDLEVSSGMFAAARLRMGVEEHDGGAQLVRFRVWPRWSAGGVAAAVILVMLSSLAAADAAWPVSAIFGASAVALATTATLQGATACGVATDAVAYQRQPAAEGAAPWPVQA